MTVSTEDLIKIVNTGSGDSTVLDRCLELATSLVGTYTVRVEDGLIPEVVLDEAVLMVAADQFNRRKAPNGIVNQQFAGLDGVSTPVRINRDPYASIRQLLAPWVPTGGLRSIQLSNPIDDPT